MGREGQMHRERGRRGWEGRKRMRKLWVVLGREGDV